MSKIKGFSLTNPVGLESMVILMFFTPSRSKSHPPHWTVKNDSNSKTARDMGEKEDTQDSHIIAGNFLWFVGVGFIAANLQRNVTSFPLAISFFCRKQHDTWTTFATALIEFRKRFSTNT